MTALAVPHVVEQIGSYAGFVAVVGLAVLSALYISQARDVRRLREWAGRAPERAAEQAARGVPQPVPGRTVTARPVTRPAPGHPAAAAAPAGGAAGTPAGAAAATAAGAAAGTASAAAAAGTPAGAAAPTAPAAGTTAPGAGASPAAAPAASGPGASGGGTVPGPATPGGAAQAAGGPTPPPAPGPGEESRDGDGKPDGDDAPAGAEAAAPAGDASPPEVAPVPVPAGGTKDDEEDAGPEGAASNGAPAEPPRPPERAPRPAASLPRRPVPLPSSRPSQTAIPPRPGSKRAARRGPRARYVALAVVGVLVVGAGAAIGVPKLLEEDDAAPATREAAKTGRASPQPAVAPDEITVSVLNGTTVPGLAAQVGDQVENEGFVLGNVTNASEQQRADSVVMYAPGHTRDARLVARRLRLSRSVEPVDPDSRGLAGDATVVVVVGQDQTR